MYLKTIQLFVDQALKNYYAALGCEAELYDAQDNIAARISTGGYTIFDGKKYTTVVYGDTTGDGDINIFDIIAVLDYINGGVSVNP